MRLTSKKILDTRYKKNDGTCAIKIRVTLNRKTFEIPAGVCIHPKEWNDKKSEVKASCKSVKNVSRLNNRLNKLVLDAEDKIFQLQDLGRLNSMTLKEIKAYVLNKSEEKYLIEYTKSIIAQLRQAGKIGNARVYKTFCNSASSFLDQSDIPLRTVSFSWLKSYEAWYLGKGNSINGLRLHMRTLRATLNRAIKEKLLSKDNYPFAEYSIKSEKSRKRAISNMDLEKLKKYSPKTIQQIRAKDYFFMSFYLMGASFIDLAFLKVSNLEEGRVVFKRRKTGILYSIKITAPLQALLNKYVIDKQTNDFILNIITSEDTAAQYTQVRDELRRYNRRLKDIGQSCKIETPLTSYVARHTFATIAKFKDVPISVISQALGHTNTETTEIYLSDFEDGVMDKYHEEIIS